MRKPFHWILFTSFRNLEHNTFNFIFWVAEPLGHTFRGNETLILDISYICDQHTLLLETATCDLWSTGRADLRTTLDNGGPHKHAQGACVFGPKKGRYKMLFFTFCLGAPQTGREIKGWYVNGLPPQSPPHLSPIGWRTDKLERHNIFLAPSLKFCLAIIEDFTGQGNQNQLISSVTRYEDIFVLPRSPNHLLKLFLFKR